MVKITANNPILINQFKTRFLFILFTSFSITASLLYEAGHVSLFANLYDGNSKNFIFGKFGFNHYIRKRPGEMVAEAFTNPHLKD
ncbi:MAG: hypothetical protein DPW09_02365 [Anaerolineae bacterium]|nr:hypothetical protein [Anaerolineae bacterium]